MTTRSRKVAALLSCGAIALAIAAQYYFARKRDYMWDGIFLYAAAALLFMLVARLVDGRTRQVGRGVFSFWEEVWFAPHR